MNGWTYVCTTAELLPGERIVTWDGDTPILVVNLDGQFFALEDRCSHEDYELSSGPIDAEKGEIECVLHSARFDIRSGEPQCPPAYTPVAKFPVQLVDGVVWTRDDRQD